MAGVGRPKGVPIKPKRALIALLNERWPGWHPVLQMADIANDDTVSLQDRFSAAKEVAKYVVPQLKAVELSTDERGLKLTTITRRIIDMRHAEDASPE